MAAEPGMSTSTERTEGEYVVSLTLRGVFEVIQRRLWIIVVVAVILAGTAVGYSALQTPMYEASIVMLVGQERVREGDPIQNAGDLEQLTRTMAAAVDRRPVAEAVIQQLGLEITQEEFLKRLKAQQIPNTQLVKVDYEDPDQDRVQQVANAIGDVFSEQISTFSPSASAVTASVYERAVIPEEPVSPKPVRNGFVALVLGLMFGVGLSLLLEHLDDRWRSPEEVEQITGVRTFGVIPEFDPPTYSKKGGH